MITDIELKKVVDELKEEFKECELEEFPKDNVLSLEREAEEYIKKKKKELK